MNNFKYKIELDAEICKSINESILYLKNNYNVTEIEIISILKCKLKINNHLCLITNCNFCNKLFCKKTTNQRIKNEYHFCSRQCTNESQKQGLLKQKKEKHFLQNYGVINVSQNLVIRNKINKTFFKKYGGNPSCNEEIKNKKRQTSIKNWGVDNPNKSNVIINKRIETNIKKYGVEHYFQSDICREKLKEYSLKNFGVEHHMKSKEYIDNIFKNIFFERYGVTNPNYLPEVKQKIKQTCLKTHGVDNALKTKKARDNFYKSLERNENRKSSVTEDQFYEKILKPLCIKNNLTLKRQKRVGQHWFIDFYIEELKLYIQFDGILWHGIDKTFEELDLLIEKHGTNSLWFGVRKNKTKDQIQKEYFQNKNLNLLRITDEDYLNNNLNDLYMAINNN